MKISFDIECTPQEARAFLGLPDLEPLHERYLDRMKNLVDDMVGPADLEKMAQAWLPGMAKTMDAWPQAFWAMATRQKPPE